MSASFKNRKRVLIKGVCMSAAFQLNRNAKEVVHAGKLFY